MSNQALSTGTVIKSPKHTYTIRRVLGQGGFGITYLVDTPLKMGNISFKAKFALKELFVDIYCFRREKSTEMEFHQSKASDVERFKQAFVSEALRLQKLGLGHPNIIKVDEVFEANGTAYYVMEYLEGATLTDYVATHGKRFNFAQTSTLLRPICDAVAMLHDNKVAHYDIKPHNIMIQQDDDGLRPVLIDFGLAKHYDGQGQATSTIAAAGYSPGFAPLEQLAGFRQFSPTADVYALAATFVYCLTGHAPAPAAELNRNALRDELQTVGLDSLRTSALLKALSLLPADRTPDAAAFRDVLYAMMTEAQAVFHTQVESQPKPELKPEQNPEPDEPTEPDDEDEILRAIEEYYSDLEQAEKSAQKPVYRTEPRNLDLQVQYGFDTHYYFSVDEWNSLPESEKREFQKSGLVIDYWGQRFVVGLNMYYEFNGSKYKREFYWEEAKRIEAKQTAGWQLPNKRQAQALAIQYKDVCRAIKAFSGDDNPALWYWTADKFDESSACTYSLYDGRVGHTYTFDSGRIRFIRNINCTDIFYNVTSGA